MHYSYANQTRIGKKLDPNYQVPIAVVKKTKTIAKRTAKEIKVSDEEDTDEIVETKASNKRELKVKRKS